MKYIRLSFVLILFFGLGYPLLMTGIAQVLFPWKANGSMIYDAQGKVIGSELIGQEIKSVNYFHGRVSSIDYNAGASGSNNYAPSNEKMIKRTEEDAKALLNGNPGKTMKEIPMDLVTNSGSGLDPHITPEAAYFQVSRVARENGLSEQIVKNLVQKHIEDKVWIFGQPRVNVLKINRALQKLVSE